MNQSPGSGFEPEIVIIFCRQSVAADLDPMTAPLAAKDLRLKFASMTCSSKLELPHLFRVMEGGMDGIMLVACPVDGCARMQGSTLSGRRIERGKKLLAEAGLAPERIVLERGSGLSAEQLADRARQFAEILRPLGPSPMKGVSQK
jgi:coenzyme F420-reducing hydrogenase delta subunit